MVARVEALLYPTFMQNWTGQFLVATPDLVDPTFRRSVVLICQHNADGALGLIINRPSDDTVGSVLPLACGDASLLDDSVWHGGPVGTEGVFILHDTGGGAEPPVTEGVSFGGDEALLQELLEKDSLGEEFRARLYLGYAGWGEGQLEFEMSAESWIVVPATSSQVFCRPNVDLWRDIMRGLGGDNAFAALAPDDPELN